MKPQQIKSEEIMNRVVQQLLPSEKRQLIERLTRELEKDEPSWLGCMAETGEIVGDIISPVIKVDEWEVLKS